MFSFTNGQTTSNGICSTDFSKYDETCVIQYLKQQLDFQSVELQELRREIKLLKTKDCSDILNQGYSTSGVYEIFQPEMTHVYCDMETDGGGWTVILNRQNHDVDFDRTWIEYKYGFGNVSGNHWLGNNYLHSMTSQRDYKLRIDLSDWNDARRHAIYAFFRVGSEFDKYQLLFDKYLSEASSLGDSLAYHNAMYFSTKDRDHDQYSGHCATSFSGGFWYNSCLRQGLTNYYASGPSGDYGKHQDDVMSWHSWLGKNYSLKTAKIMIKPMN